MIPALSLAASLFGTPAVSQALPTAQNPGPPRAPASAKSSLRLAKRLILSKLANQPRSLVFKVRHRFNMWSSLS